jgi:hypothetical protein
MGVDLDAKLVDDLGDAQGVSRLSRFEAFDLLKRECQKLQTRGTAVLAKSYNVWRKSEGGGWGQSDSALFGNPFARATATKTSSSYWYSDELRLDIDFARVMDPAICTQTDVNPEARESYTGPEEPLG